MSSNKIYYHDDDIDRNENKINVNHCTHPRLHVGEEVLELGEADLGRGHELLHHGEVAVARAEGLAAVELHLPAALLHPGPQLAHVLLQLLHAEIRGIICNVSSLCYIRGFVTDCNKCIRTIQINERFVSKRPAVSHT